MKKVYFALMLAVAGLSFSIAQEAKAATLADRLAGRIVIDVETRGEAWYIEPASKVRYYLGRAADAFAVMRQLGVGISEGNFQKIAQSGTKVSGNLAFARTLSGKIILQVERNGEAWYVNPVDLKKYFLGKPEDAYQVMRRLGLGIKKADLAKIPRAFKDDAANTFSNYKFNEKIAVAGGAVYADVVEIALGQLNPKIITDTAGVENCSAGCPTKALYDYVANQQAFAAINGVYGAPFYNTLSRRMINEGRLKIAGTGPVIAFDENNKFYYFASPASFKSADFGGTVYSARLSAAFAGKVKLVEDGTLKSYLADGRMARSAFGFKKTGLNPQGTIYLVSARSATTGELAKALKALGADYAVSLDSGGATNLFYHDEYKIGPNGNAANAILFALK